MADRIVLLSRGEGSRAQEILDAFAERTGLQPHEIPGGAEFPLEGKDHEIEVVQTLTGIDPSWTDHVALGSPEGGHPAG
jgi:hypothetical protein